MNGSDNTRRTAGVGPPPIAIQTTEPTRKRWRQTTKESVCGTLSMVDRFESNVTGRYFR